MNRLELEKLAGAAARDYVRGDVPLNDSVTKIAKSMGMNRNQIHRLCEATNNATFNEVFNSEKLASEKERFVDFDVADAKVVIASIHGEEKVAHVATPSFEASAFEIPDMRPGFEKVASQEVFKPHDRHLASIEEHDRAVFHEKVAVLVERLRMEKEASAFRYVDALEATKKFSRQVSRDTYLEAEKTAAWRYGAACEPFLNDARREIGLPEAEVKCAADTEAYVHPVFETLHNTYFRVKNASIALKQVESKVND